jgi:hypothetical protein
VLMNVVNSANAWTLVTTRPLAAVVYLVSVVALVLLNRSALQTLRTLAR